MTEATQPPKTCFVAMPITTQPEHVDDYDGDRDHFVHVLDHLFVPAIERAGFEVIKPIMEGADLIQAEIVRRLEQADLVLCDLSRHNPNVFFELGVRTSLDKPVCLVRDNFTERLPFDTSVLNTHAYSADLSPWHLEAQVGLLAAHLAASARTSGGRNPLWQYFGLTQRASPGAVEGNPVEAKLDVLMREVAGLARGGEARRSAAVPSFGGPRRARVEDLAFESVANDPGSLLTLDNADLTEALADRDLPLTKAEHASLRDLNGFFVRMHGRSLLLMGLQDKNNGGGTVAYLHSPVPLLPTEVEMLQDMVGQATFSVVISQPGAPVAHLSS